jgi:hypothetical protein
MIKYSIDARVMDYSPLNYFLQDVVVLNVTDNTTATWGGPAIFHKSTMEFPPTLMDVIGIIVLMGMAFLANAGGLGGGGLLTPFMMIFLKLSIIECVPIANFFGWLAAFTRFIINFK